MVAVSPMRIPPGVALAGIAWLFAASPVNAQAEATEPPPVKRSEARPVRQARLVRQPYLSTTGQERDTFVYLPADYDSDPERHWPVLLFLHGDGERGDGKEDLDWVTVHGPLSPTAATAPGTWRRATPGASRPSPPSSAGATPT